MNRLYYKRKMIRANLINCFKQPIGWLCRVVGGKLKRIKPVFWK